MDDAVRLNPPEPADPALHGLRAKVYKTVSEVADALHTAPGHVGLYLDDRGRRAATLNFDSINDAGAWADWLHWPFATYNRDGTLQLAAYGQWLGFSVQLLGTEPQTSPAGRDPEPAPEVPAIATTGRPGQASA